MTTLVSLPPACADSTLLREWEVSDFWTSRDTHIQDALEHATIIARQDADQVAAHVAAASALAKAVDLAGPCSADGPRLIRQCAWFLFRARAICEAAPLDQIL